VNNTIAERDRRLKTCTIVIKVKDYEYDSSYDYKTSWQKRLASTTVAGSKKALKLLSSPARKSPFVAGVKTCLVL